MLNSFFFFENMFVYYVVPAVSQHKLTHRAVVSLRIKSTPAQTYQQPSFSAKQASTSDSKASETTLSIGPGCSLVSRDRGQLPAMPLPVAPHDQLSSSCLLPNSSRLGVYIYICHNGPYSGAFSFQNRRINGNSQEANCEKGQRFLFSPIHSLYLCISLLQLLLV